jgi:hypothetical protein
MGRLGKQEGEGWKIPKQGMKYSKIPASGVEAKSFAHPHTVILLLRDQCYFLVRPHQW